MPQKANSTSPRVTRWLKLSVKLMGPAEVRDHLFFFASVPTLNRRKAWFSGNVKYSAKLQNGLCNFRSIAIKGAVNRVKFPRRLNTLGSAVHHRLERSDDNADLSLRLDLAFSKPKTSLHPTFVFDLKEGSCFDTKGSIKRLRSLNITSGMTFSLL